MVEKKDGDAKPEMSAWEILNADLDEDIEDCTRNPFALFERAGIILNVLEDQFTIKTQDRFP